MTSVGYPLRTAYPGEGAAAFTPTAIIIIHSRLVRDWHEAMLKHHNAPHIGILFRRNAIYFLSALS